MGGLRRRWRSEFVLQTVTPQHKNNIMSRIMFKIHSIEELELGDFFKKGNQPANGRSKTNSVFLGLVALCYVASVAGGKSPHHLFFWRSPNRPLQCIHCLWVYELNYRG